MGKIRQGITGGFSGGVGNAVGVSRKGIDYVRNYAASVSNPQTERQMDHRMKIALTMKFLKPLSGFLRWGFKDDAIKMTAINAAMSWNFRNAIQGIYPAYTINYANALLAHGNLAPALNPVASSAVTGKILFKWEDNSSEMNAGTFDQTWMVVYNPSKNQALFLENAGNRADKTQSITVPDNFSGDLVHCYIAFASMDGLALSNSNYAGAIMVA